MQIILFLSSFLWFCRMDCSAVGTAAIGECWCGAGGRILSEILCGWVFLLQGFVLHCTAARWSVLRTLSVSGSNVVANLCASIKEFFHHHHNRRPNFTAVMECNEMHLIKCCTIFNFEVLEYSFLLSMSHRAAHFSVNIFNWQSDEQKKCI